MKHKFHWHSHEHYRRHRHGHPVLIVGNRLYTLEPNRRLHVAATNTIGAAAPLALAIGFLDQNGHPMLATPTPDAPPTWTNTVPADETLAVSADGLTCAATAVAAGADEIDVSVTVGGVAFKAALAVTVAAQPQVLTSVEITVTGGGV